MIPHVLGPWVRGVNYALPAEELSPDEIFSMENMIVGVGGNVFQRPGIKPYINAAANGANTLTACGKHKFSSAASSVFCISGAKFLEDVSGTWTDRTNGETITAGDGNVWSLANCNGVLIGVNGVNGDALLRWNASGNLTSGGLTGQQVTWATWAEWWDGRLWLGNSNNGVGRTNFTSNTSLTTAGANDWFDIGEPMTGQRAFGDAALALHGERTIQILLPTNNASIPYRRIGRSRRGTIAGRSLVTVAAPGIPQMQLFVRQDGIYRFMGTEAEKISWKLDGARFWDQVKDNDLTDSFAEVNLNRNEVWFFLPYGTSQATFNKIIVYNYLRDIWYGPHAIHSSIYNTFNCAGDIGGVIHAGGYNNSGRLYKMDFTDKLNDDQDGTTVAAIRAEFFTGAPHPVGPDTSNRYLSLRSSYDVKGAYQVNVTHFAPGIPSDTQTFEQGGGFDAIETSFKIGTSQIAGEDMMASLDTDLNGYDPTIQLKFENGSLNEEFGMRRATVMYRPLKSMRKVNAGVY